MYYFEQNTPQNWVIFHEKMYNDSPAPPPGEIRVKAIEKNTSTNISILKSRYAAENLEKIHTKTTKRHIQILILVYQCIVY